mgnify:CR=1 FL=1|tara:strand:- start:568 stop:1281 length:714 start_codon:yes stop_codon:yes gene_type:complete
MANGHSAIDSLIANATLQRYQEGGEVKPTVGQRFVQRFPSQHKDPIRAAEQERGLTKLIDFIAPQSLGELGAMMAAGPLASKAFKVAKKATKAAKNLVHPRRYSAKDLEMVTLDVAEMDELWKLDADSYFKKGAGSQSKQAEIIKRIDNEEELSAPIVDLFKVPSNWQAPSAGKIRLDFTDGRNRFATLRDSGAEKINVVMDKNSINLLDDALTQAKKDIRKRMQPEKEEVWITLYD